VQVTHASVWSNVVAKSPDQLRQRVAWALAQIFVVNTAGVVRHHVFLPVVPMFSPPSSPATVPPRGVAVRENCVVNAC